MDDWLDWFTVGLRMSFRIFREDRLLLKIHEKKANSMAMIMRSSINLLIELLNVQTKVLFFAW